MTTMRQNCQAGLIINADDSRGILVAGGYNSETTAEYLNLDTLLWEPRASLPQDVHYGASVPYQDSFLIVGGNTGSTLETIYYYNPTFDRWDLLYEMNLGRENLAAFLVPDSYANCS